MAIPEEASFGAEVQAGLDRDALPAYASMLSAFHRACASELQGIVAQLPIQPDMRVLDMACGDGVYSAWLAQRVGPAGHVVGVDIAPAYLDLARKHAQSRGTHNISFQTADIDALPFADNEFDLAWCAHSLHSLPDPLAVLRELRRVVRPGGAVAILENDTLHHMLLPWPADLELAVRQAQLEVLHTTTSSTGRFYIGRNLCTVFKTAGLTACHIRTHTVDHRAPLSADERMYLEGYLGDLAERARPHLDPAARTAFDMLMNPRSRLYMLDQPDFFASHLEIVAWARK